MATLLLRYSNQRCIADMLVKLGNIWVNPQKVEAIIPPYSDKVLGKSVDIYIEGRNVVMLTGEIVGAETHEQFLGRADEYAGVVNAAGAPSYPET